MRRWFVTAAVMGFAVLAFASAGSVSVFNTTYKVDKNSDLGKAGCVVCHTKKGSKDLNAYGKDLAAALKAANTKKITAAILQKVEKLDSTKTGKTNIQKIKAGLNPGAK